MAGWRWAAASRRGTAHLRAGTRKQDALSCSLGGARRNVLIAIVSDGAGSAEQGGEGASLVCRTIACAARDWLDRSSELPADEVIHAWLMRARARIAEAAERRLAPMRAFAATCVAVVSDGAATVIAHIGDGAAIMRPAGADWRAASWPEQGEYASTTYFVTDERELRLRITRIADEVTGLAVFSDGLESVALDLDAGTAHVPFFAQVIKPVDEAQALGRSAYLSERLGALLDSGRVNDRTDDDKSLILASRR